MKINNRNSLIKSILAGFEKGVKTGVYKDTPENRKLGRVGQKYSQADATRVEDTKIRGIKNDIKNIDVVLGQLKEAGRSDSDHYQALEKRKENLENEISSHNEKKEKAKLEKKKADYRGSDEMWTDLESVRYAEDRIKEIREQKKDNELGLEEIYVDAKKEGFDDPSEYQGYKDYLEGQADLDKELEEQNQIITEANQRLKDNDAL